MMCAALYANALFKNGNTFRFIHQEHVHVSPSHVSGSHHAFLKFKNEFINRNDEPILEKRCCVEIFPPLNIP